MAQALSTDLQQMLIGLGSRGLELRDLLQNLSSGNDKLDFDGGAISSNGSGKLTAAAFAGDGSALTGVGGVVQEVKNDDGAGNVTFTNRAANFYVALISYTASGVNITLPTPSINYWVATLIVDCSDAGPDGPSPAEQLNGTLGSPGLCSQPFDSNVSVASTAILCYYTTATGWQTPGLSTQALVVGEAGGFFFVNNSGTIAEQG